MSEPLNEVATPESAPPLDVAQAVRQLRAAVCGLGVLVLVLSAAFNLFVWKQNRNLVATANTRQPQLKQMRINVQRLGGAATELANYSEGRPELTAIFKRYGIELKSAPPAAKP